MEETEPKNESPVFFFKRVFNQSNSQKLGEGLFFDRCNRQVVVCRGKTARRYSFRQADPINWKEITSVHSNKAPKSNNKLNNKLNNTKLNNNTKTSTDSPSKSPDSCPSSQQIINTSRCASNRAKS